MWFLQVVYYMCSDQVSFIKFKNSILLHCHLFQNSSLLWSSKNPHFSWYSMNDSKLAINNFQDSVCESFCTYPVIREQNETTVEFFIHLGIKKCHLGGIGRDYKGHSVQASHEHLLWQLNKKNENIKTVLWLKFLKYFIVDEDEIKK